MTILLTRGVAKENGEVFCFVIKVFLFTSTFLKFYFVTRKKLNSAQLRTNFERPQPVWRILAVSTVQNKKET